MRRLLRNFLCLCLLWASFPYVSYAFYEDNSIELRGQLRLFGVNINNPNNPWVYQEQNIAELGGVARLMLDVHMGSSFSYEAHVVQSYVPTSLQTGGVRNAVVQGVERSGVLDWSFANQQGHVLFDRLNMQYTTDMLNIKMGRQPINLATTFFFTPNDFFAAFSAQTFYRSYKSGVDAARVDVQWGELTQLSLIGVLGYAPDLSSVSSDSGRSHQPDAARASYITRIATMSGDFEWAVMGGVVRKNRVLGGDVQGELFEWLGIRAEGHKTWSDKPTQTSFSEFVLGLEHRWENSLTLRLEQFYHGAGAGSVNDYTAATQDNIYLAKHYTALGASYEISPLLTGDLTCLYNGVDASSLLAVQMLYSLSDESELSIQANIPMGKSSNSPTTQSEFGLYPNIINVEWRTDF